MILAFLSLHFPIKIPSNFQAFSGTPSWTSFFRLLMRLGAKMMDFGTPLAPSGVQNDAQNRPSGVKIGFRKLPSRFQKKHLLPKTLSERNLAPFWSILHHFGIILDEFWMISDGCWHHFCQSSDIFPDRQRRVVRNRLTENIKNLQISAETCKSQTQPETQTPTLQPRICKLQNASSCTERRSTNAWGGGTRAARRTQILLILLLFFVFPKPFWLF